MALPQPRSPSELPLQSVQVTSLKPTLTLTPFSIHCATQAPGDNLLEVPWELSASWASFPGFLGAGQATQGPGGHRCQNRGSLSIPLLL